MQAPKVWLIIRVKS